MVILLTKFQDNLLQCMKFLKGLIEVIVFRIKQTSKNSKHMLVQSFSLKLIYKKNVEVDFART